MAVTNYFTVNGQILGEKTTGSSRSDYLRDALGSVIGTVNQSAQVVNTYRHKPFGDQLARTGSGADPLYGWLGLDGYRVTGARNAEKYVRYRHYRSIGGNWITKDPIVYYPMRGGFAYVQGAPTKWSDPTGLLQAIPWPVQLPEDPNATPGCCAEKVKECLPTGPLGRACPSGWQYPGFNTEYDRWATECFQKGNCSDIVSRIANVAASCQDRCVRAITPGAPANPVPGQTFEAWAVTLCCKDADGTRRLCGFRWCFGAPHFPKDPCVRVCLLRHEMQHAMQKDLDCPGDLSAPEGSNAPAWTECNAYSVELNCLLEVAAHLKCGIPLSVLDGILKCQDAVQTANSPPIR